MTFKWCTNIWYLENTLPFSPSVDFQRLPALGKRPRSFVINSLLVHAQSASIDPQPSFSRHISFHSIYVYSLSLSFCFPIPILVAAMPSDIRSFFGGRGQVGGGNQESAASRKGVRTKQKNLLKHRSSRICPQLLQTLCCSCSYIHILTVRKRETQNSR